MDPCRTEKSKGADRSNFRLESVWSEKRALRRDPGLVVGRGARVRNKPGGVRAQSSPGAQAPKRPAFLPQQSKASGPPEPPPPTPASRLERLRKEAVPAPPRAAPTSWRKMLSRTRAGNLCPPLQRSVLVRVCADLKEQNNSAPKIQLTFVLLSNTLIDEKFRRPNYPV